MHCPAAFPRHSTAPNGTRRARNRSRRSPGVPRPAGGWPPTTWSHRSRRRPERPQVELDATLGDGDALDRVLERAGVGRSDAGAVARLVSGAVALGDIRPGTRLDLTLGRRPDRTVARPLERLAFRARFDLNLSLVRSAGALVMTRQPIAIDRTPLTVEGLVGASLYRSARAAGAPAKAIEDYIKAIATKLSIGRDIGADDRFRLVIDQARAATGEVQTGALQLAEIDQGSRPLRLVRFAQGGHDDWYDADGQVERQGFMGMPVAGHITSSFGMRFHPILGFSRMHKGIDIGAPTGTPVFAVVDGVVRSAGWTGGYGNFIKLAHAGALMTGYGHLSRIAVGAGQHVRRGEVIGYVGSTGMSTGPHLHWEVWKNGTAINPQSLSFASVATLSGEAMRAFRAKLSDLLVGRAPAR